MRLSTRVCGNERAFTLTEVIGSVVVLAIVCSIAVPSYHKTAEEQRKSRAASILQLIRQGELVYEAINGRYTPNLADLTTIQPPSTTEFSYSVAIPGATQFIVTASRVNGGPACTMTLDRAGQFRNCGQVSATMATLPGNQPAGPTAALPTLPAPVPVPGPIAGGNPVPVPADPIPGPTTGGDSAGGVGGGALGLD